MSSLSIRTHFSFVHYTLHIHGSRLLFGWGNQLLPRRTKTPMLYNYGWHTIIRGKLLGKNCLGYGRSDFGDASPKFGSGKMCDWSGGFTFLNSFVNIWFSQAKTSFRRTSIVKIPRFSTGCSKDIFQNCVLLNLKCNQLHDLVGSSG